MMFTIIWSWWLTCFIFNQNLSSENSKALASCHCFMKGDRERDREREGGGGGREEEKEGRRGGWGRKRQRRRRTGKKEKKNSHLRTQCLQSIFSPWLPPRNTQAELALCIFDLYNHKIPCVQKIPVLSWIFCCHCLEISNNFRTSTLRIYFAL